MPYHVMHDGVETQSRLRKCCENIANYITQRIDPSTIASPEAVPTTRSAAPTAQVDKKFVKNVSKSPKRFNTRSVPRILDGTYDEGLEVSRNHSRYDSSLLIGVRQIISDGEAPETQRRVLPAHPERYAQ